MKWNRYTKKLGTKTAYEISEGSPVFSKDLYLIEPIYIRTTSPRYSLVSRGKHISGLFKLMDGIYTGDYLSNLLILLMSEDGSVFELILTDIPKSKGHQLLVNGELNSLIGKARKEAERGKLVK